MKKVVLDKQSLLEQSEYDTAVAAHLVRLQLLECDIPVDVPFPKIEKTVINVLRGSLSCYYDQNLITFEWYDDNE
tara:strand:+ start:14297 stop:14521 length:225 start_codon:yes stop_codon:yes gene_type:complete